VKFRDPPEDNRAATAAVVAADGPVPREWLVMRADGGLPNRIERFAGANAMLQSLRYAHDEYGRVRWLMN